MAASDSSLKETCTTFFNAISTNPGIHNHNIIKQFKASTSVVHVLAHPFVDSRLNTFGINLSINFNICVCGNPTAENTGPLFYIVDFFKAEAGGNLQMQYNPI